MLSHGLRKDLRALVDDSISSVASRHLAFHRAFGAFWEDQPSSVNDFDCEGSGEWDLPTILLLLPTHMHEVKWRQFRKCSKKCQALKWRQWSCFFVQVRTPCFTPPFSFNKRRTCK